jgi:hypothetical protein
MLIVASPFSFVEQSTFAIAPLVAEAQCGGCGGAEGADGTRGGDHEIVTQPPVCTLSASPASIDKGDNVTLKWATTNATSVTINQSVGAVALDGSKVVRDVNATKTFTLTATGRGGTVQCSDKVVVKVTPKPTCTLSVTPGTIASGGSATVKWTTSNAKTVSINQGVGSVSLDGSRAINNITSSKTFTLTAKGDGGTVTCTDNIVVQQVVTPQPTCTLSASPRNVANGGSTTLTWTTNNATSVSINQGIGSVALDGSRAVNNITSNKNFTLTATGAGGTVTCDDSVTVQQIPNAPTCEISVHPGTVQYGGSATVTWSSTNASSASINQGIGSVALSGSRAINSIYTPRTYVLTVTGTGGTATCSDSIDVQEEEEEDVSCNIWASDTRIERGESTTVSWGSDNATSATLTSFGSVSLDGTRSVSPYHTTTYTLTVRNSNDSRTCSTTIYVDEQEEERPSCWIDLEVYQYAASHTYDWNGFGGSTGELAWGSSNATSAYITNVGSVGTQGSRTVQGATAQTYVLTVYGPGGSATCHTTHTPPPPPPPPAPLYCSIRVLQNTQNGAILSWTSNGANTAWINDGIGAVQTNGSLTVRPNGARTYVLTVTDYAGRTASCQTFVNTIQTPYITLTQIPYTGFGDSTMIALYWSAIAVLTLLAGYVVVARTGVLQYAFASSRRNSSHEAIKREWAEAKASVATIATSGSDRMVIERSKGGAPTLSVIRS